MSLADVVFPRLPFGGRRLDKAAAQRLADAQGCTMEDIIRRAHAILRPPAPYSQPPPTPANFFSLNHQPPYATKGGVPLVLMGGVGRHASTDIIVRRWAELLFTLGVDVRVRTYPENPIEDREEFLHARRFLHWEPEMPFAAVGMVGIDARLPAERVAFKTVWDACDSFRCFRPEVVRLWNECDAIITPSKHSANVLRERGVERVQIVPLGVDAARFYPETVDRTFPLPDVARVVFNSKATVLRERPAIPESLFVFFCCGMMQHRKGIEETIRAFCKAFTHDDLVLLWVHGRGTAWGKHDAVNVMAECAEIAWSPALLWTDGAVSDNDLRRMLCRADCYVSAHKLEGFGLMPLQAMSCGTPAIVTAYSGPLDYAHSRNAFLLPAREVDAHAPGVPEGVRWAEWKEDDLISLMRRVVDAPSERKRKAQSGLKTARRWTWEQSAKSLLRAVAVPIARRVRAKNNGRCAILIPVRNGVSDVDRMLQSLFRVDAGYPFEVFVCDDGSNDGTFEMLFRQWTPMGVHVLRNSEPRGCPFARNRLFAESGDSEWCFVCDCDLEFVQDGWLKTLIELHRASSAGITAPLLLYPDGLVQSAGGTTDADGVPCLHRFYRQEVTDEVLKPCEVVYAPSAAWLLRRELLGEVGGLWEGYAPTYYDDVDFCYNVRRAGKTVRYEPSVKIIHHEGSFQSRKRESELARNRDLFKHFWGKD